MTDMIILRERVITIKAGDTFDQSLQGNVLRVTGGLVPLRVQGRDQQMDFTLLAGERAEFPGEFPGLILSHNSGVDQTFTIQVGKGVNVASALVSGSVTITGTPTVNVSGNINGINSEVKTTNIIDDFVSFSTNTNLAANTPLTVVSPASNVNGILIKRVNASSLAGGHQMAMIVKSSNPASVIDGSVINSAMEPTSGTSAYLNINSDREVKIGPGLGLFFIVSGAESQTQKTVLYKLL